MYIPLDPEKGLNPQLLVCPICGEHNGEIGIGRIMAWRHRCGALTVSQHGRGPRTYDPFCCGNCGVDADTRRWSFDGDYDAARHGPLAGREPCERCRGWLQDACIIKCSGCRHMHAGGVYTAKTEHDSRAYRKENGDLDHDEGVRLGLLEKLVGRVVPVTTCDLCPTSAADAPPTAAAP